MIRQQQSACSTDDDVSEDSLGVTMPVLAGMEGARAVVHTHRAGSVVKPAENRLPGSSSEFPRRSFVLKNPRGQKEGGSKENLPISQQPEGKRKSKDHNAPFDCQVPLEGVGPFETREGMKRHSSHTSKCHQTPHNRFSRPTPLQTSRATRSKPTPIPRPHAPTQSTRHSSSSTHHNHCHCRFQPPPAPRNSFKPSRHHMRASDQHCLHCLPKSAPVITPPTSININLNLTITTPTNTQKKTGPRPIIHPRIKNVHYQFRSILLVINDNGSKTVYDLYSVSMYQSFDKDIRNGHLPINPGGYNNFAIKFNKVSGIAQKFISLNSNNIYTSSAQPVRLADLDFSMYPVKSGYCVPQLETAGISNTDGTTDANNVKTSHKDDF
ncbi:hypothetical protein BJ165DRAFT_1533221 [Panaeolus papilionaceus]|nr:hypothetical protein BJ165DRAFT_1533221 [Panaeolus papilionaceus]